MNRSLIRIPAVLVGLLFCAGIVTAFMASMDQGCSRSPWSVAGAVGFTFVFFIVAYGVAENMQHMLNREALKRYGM